MSQDTIFHKIVSKEIPAYVILEDDKHLAFLDIFPAVEGQALVIPKSYTTSNFAEADSDLMSSTMLFAQQVAKKMEEKLDNLERVIVIIEGLEIDYLHIKLFPKYKGKHGPTPHGEKAIEAELLRLQEILST